MNVLDFIRTLIWDANKTKFSDEVLQEYYARNGENPYRTAAFALQVALGDEDKVKAYREGGISITYGNIQPTINMYRSMAGDTGIVTVAAEKVYT